jgi:hypothetical protein
VLDFIMFTNSVPFNICKILSCSPFVFLAICARFDHVHQLCSWQYVLDFAIRNIIGEHDQIYHILPGTQLVNMIKSTTYCQEHDWWTRSNLAHLSCSPVMFLVICARFDHVHQLCSWQYVLDLIMFTNHVPGTYYQEHKGWTWSNLARIAMNITGL